MTSTKPATQIKVCGVTRVEDALAAAGLGVDALGFIFVPTSRRAITPAAAAAIVAELPSSVRTVGVFADVASETVAETMATVGLGVAQLHGSESLAYVSGLGKPVIKGFRVTGPETVARARSYAGTATVLLDGPHPGSGEGFDHSALDDVDSDFVSTVYLAGGLGPDDVGDLVRSYRPAGVDVASGVESAPGIKDHAKLAAFVAAVRSAA